MRQFRLAVISVFTGAIGALVAYAFGLGVRLPLVPHVVTQGLIIAPVTLAVLLSAIEMKTWIRANEWLRAIALLAMVGVIAGTVVALRILRPWAPGIRLVPSSIGNAVIAAVLVVAALLVVRRVFYEQPEKKRLRIVALPASAAALAIAGILMSGTAEQVWFRSQTQVVRAFIHAGAERDTAAMNALAGEAPPIEFWHGTQLYDTALFHLLDSSGLRYDWGILDDGHTIVQYDVLAPQVQFHPLGRSVIQAILERRHEQWLLVSLMPGHR